MQCFVIAHSRTRYMFTEREKRTGTVPWVYMVVLNGGVKGSAPSVDGRVLL